MDGLYNKVQSMNTIFSIWRYSELLRVTYVSEQWLVVWDHQENPPIRHDCKGDTHHQACTLVVQKLRNLSV